MRKEANFNNSIAEILRKSRREEREMMQWEGERKSNFNISIAEIPKKKKDNKYFSITEMVFISISNC